jgi:hypothetical protein
MPTETRNGFPVGWRILGYFLLGATSLFVGRILYEETLLTWLDGPQMVGFAMAHGAVPFIFLAGMIGIPGGLLWIVASVIMRVWKKSPLLGIDWIPLIALPVVMSLLLVPYSFWEEFVVRVAGPGANGDDFLITAAANGQERLVKHLLKKGYDINHESSTGTPLSAAAVMGNARMVKVLLSHGAKIDQKDSLVGETALMGAAEEGKSETVQALLESGADPCLLDNKGHTAEGLARKFHHPAIADDLARRFHCPEHVVDPCADPAVSACVHP